MRTLGATKWISRARAECGVVLFCRLSETWPMTLHCPISVSPSLLPRALAGVLGGPLGTLLISNNPTRREEGGTMSTFLLTG
jgi:hypothetical protein